ncbi:MAG TPA: transcriptional repressor [Casimicrobiaceae bacterium]|nr:transcriptional repressor [Casimicrobiaceae bacterium]
MERTTRQREAIQAVIRAARRPLSPREVLDGARASVHGLGMATVYRTLKLLVEQGSVRAIQLPGDSPRFEPAQSAHHHHFQCMHCQRVYDVPGCPGDMRRLAPRGFVVERHDLTLYGRCSACSRGRARAWR